MFDINPGLSFWMLISFGVVFFILAKYGFPIIVKMVETRKEYIEHSLLGAKEAQEQLAGIKIEGDKMVAQAREKQLELIKDASDMREKLIKEAKEQAQTEADKVMENARLTIQKEKEDAMKDIRSQVVQLSVEIAEKILRKNLDNKPAQLELIDKLLDEAKN